jgi:hypothetical protein
MAATRGVLSDDRYKAAQLAAHLNPAVQLLTKNRAGLKLPDGSVRGITNSTVYVRMFWGCEGCKQGVQHYRFATPHGLSKALALRCLFCSYDADEWKAAHRQQLDQSELWLMGKLVKAGLDLQWSCQAAPTWWKAAVDFKHMTQKAAMQVDGSSHFRGIHDTQSRDALETDMRCCVAAIKANVSMIRVHDLQNTMWLDDAFLPKATHIALNNLCVVLSLGFSNTTIYVDGCMRTYAGMLAEKLGGKEVTKLPWGLVIYCNK